MTVSPVSWDNGSGVEVGFGLETSHSMSFRLNWRSAAGSSSVLSGFEGSMVLYAPSQWGLVTPSISSVDGSESSMDALAVALASGPRLD